MKQNKIKATTETKYDCPFYNSKGGHCEKSKSVSAWGTVSVFGCRYPNDISKCQYNKKARDCIHYHNFACHRKSGSQATCSMFSKGYCPYHSEKW